MRLLREKFEPLWDGNCPEAGSLPMPNCDFNAYLDRVAQRHTWGGALELTALAEYLDASVLVLGPHQPPAIYNIDAGSRMLALWFCGDHYECLNGPLPEDLVHCPVEGSSGACEVAASLCPLPAPSPHRESSLAMVESGLCAAGAHHFRQCGWHPVQWVMGVDCPAVSYVSPRLTLMSFSNRLEAPAGMVGGISGGAFPSA